MLRSGLFLSSLWSNAALRFYSHEIAHEYAYRLNDIKISNALDFHQWKSSYIPGLYYPGWRQNALDAQALSASELLSATTAGLTQDELNAESQWQSNSQRGAMSAFDAQAFLLTKLRDVAYMIGSGSEERPFAPGLEIHQLLRTVNERAPNLYDDVNLYRLILLNSGLHVTNRRLLQRALAVDVLSLRTWESLYSMLAFVIHGDISTKLFSISLGRNITVTPPLFSNYLASSGSFVNSSVMLGVNGRQARLEFGSMIGFGSTGFFQGCRLGLVAPGIKINRSWYIQPFAAINTTAGRRMSGYSLGMEHSFHFIKNMAFILKIEQNRNDILENLVKQEHNGFHAIAGLRRTF